MFQGFDHLEAGSLHHFVTLILVMSCIIKLRKTITVQYVSFPTIIITSLATIASQFRLSREVYGLLLHVTVWPRKWTTRSPKMNFLLV